MSAPRRALAATLAVLLLPACQAVAPAGMAPAGPVAGAPAAPAALGALAGVVTDAAGRPVAGAHLLIVGHGAQAEATSGPDGKFRVEVPATGAFAVMASAPDGQGHLLRAHATGTPAVGAEPPALALRLAVPGAVVGQVLVDGAAGPEAGADAEVHLAEAPGVATRADAAGHFVLADVPDGVWTLVVQRPGFQVARKAGMVVKDGREVHLLQAFALTRAAAGEQGGAVSVPAVISGNLASATVAGRVVDEAGTGVTGLAVRIPRSGTAPVRTDGDGRFVVAGVPYGYHTVHVGGPDHAHVGRAIHVGAAEVRLPTDLVAQSRHAVDAAVVATVLHPPVPLYHDGALSWHAVAKPAGVAKVVYDVEVEETPGQFRRVGTTDGTEIEAPLAAVGDRQVRVRARVDGAPAGAGYRLAEAAMFAGDATTSRWRYGVLSVDAAGAPVVTMAHDLERVSHLITDGSMVYAVGDSSVVLGPPESSLRAGALVRAGVNDTTGFRRLYTHDKGLSRVIANGLGVRALGSGQSIEVRSDGSKGTVFGVPGNPFGAAWADAITSNFLHLPNPASWFDPSKPAWNTVRVASSFCLTSDDDDHGTISAILTDGVPARRRTFLWPNSLAYVQGRLFATGEDGRYPGLKILAKYDAATGEQLGQPTDALDPATLGRDPSQLHGDSWAGKVYVVNQQSSSRPPAGLIAVLDKEGVRKGTIDTPSGWTLAGMAVAFDTMNNTIWVAYNRGADGQVRKYVGGVLQKTVDLPGMSIRYDHFRDASRRTIAATDSTCWLYADGNRILRVQ